MMRSMFICSAMFLLLLQGRLRELQT